MSHLSPANPPPHDFAGLRRSLALAWPRHTGHTPLVKDSNSVVWWRKPSAMRACVLLAYAVRTYVTYINDHGFLIIRCVRSPGAIASCRGQEDYCSVPNPTKKNNPQEIGRYGHFGPSLGPIFLKLIVFWTGEYKYAKPNQYWNMANNCC